MLTNIPGVLVFGLKQNTKKRKEVFGVHITELLAEAAEMTSFSEPDSLRESKEGEEVLGELPDNLKALVVLAEREVSRLADLVSEAGFRNGQTIEEVRFEFVDKLQPIKELLTTLWGKIKETFPAIGDGRPAIRKGWKVVLIPSECVGQDRRNLISVLDNVFNLSVIRVLGKS